MSVCVDIVTKKRIKAEDLFDEFVKQGEGVMVKSKEFPFIKFGSINEALRGVEVTEEDYGYQVRVCVFASEEDYKFFRNAIIVTKQLTDGKVFYDDDEQELTEDINEVFSDNWIREEQLNNLKVLRTMIRNYGEPIVLYGFFEQICIGPQLLNDFDLLNKNEITIEEVEALQNYLIAMQWEMSDLTNTSTRIVVANPNDEEADGLSVSMISISDGKVNDFDFISWADMFAIMDIENNEKYPPVLIPFKHVGKILPSGVFSRIDDYQYKREEPLTVDMVHEMMEWAEAYTPEDIHYKPTFPGSGFDEKQNTFILRWNPGVSNIKEDIHNELIPQISLDRFDWSIWEHEKAKYGDRFYLVKVGDGKTGIVMSGIFTSNPYTGGDWSGKGRVVYYMDMQPNVILNPDVIPMISTETLNQEIPSINWSKGHSGEVMTPQDAQKLEALWQDFIKSNENKIDRVNLNMLRSF